MRGILIAMLAAAAIGLAGTSGSFAAPVNGAAINDAADAARLVEDVHCRPYRHPHYWGYGYGCGVRSGVIWRGHRHHWRGGHRRGHRGGHHRGRRH